MNQRHPEPEEPAETDRQVLSTERFRGAIFDLDGVVTDTASLHFTAWKEVFDEVLREHEGSDFRPFDEADYREYVDGKPRYDGVADLLASRDISLPRGDDEAPPGQDSVIGIGNAKNERYLELLETGDIQVYEATVDVIRELRTHGVATAIVSSSKNCREVLERTGLADLFDARVDGTHIADDPDLEGKPAPDIFLAAARRIGVEPSRAFVIEDAESGIDAGRAGGFGLVVGLAHDAEARTGLAEHGADIVVSSLDALQITKQAPVEAGEAPPDARVYIDHIGTSEVAVFVGFDVCVSLTGDDGKEMVSAPVREVLDRLSAVCSVTVVSDRDAAEIRRRVALDDVVYAGNHGFELVAPDGRRLDPRPGDGFLPDLAMAADSLRELFAPIESIIVDEKRFSIAIRPTTEDIDAPAVRDRLDEALEPHPELRRFRRGDVHHIVPDVDWHEGYAIEQVLEAIDLDKPGVRPLYLGGKATGGRPFRFLAERGIAIRVGPALATSVSPDFRLAGAPEVCDFLDRLSTHMERRVQDEDWMYRYETYTPDREGVRETLCTLGNGYVATRGAAPESSADDIHYPGTYLAGGYDRLTTERSGRSVENEDLVNLPNWLPIQIRIAGGDWFDIDDLELLDFEQTLDLKRGLLHRDVRFRDKQGRVTRVRQSRFVHMDQPHLAGLKTTLEAEDWSGRLEVRSFVDGTVVNDNVAGYEGLRNNHLEVLELATPDDETAFLRTRTIQSRLEVAQATRTRFFRDGEPVTPDVDAIRDPSGRVGHRFTLEVEMGDEVVAEKLATIYTSRDRAISECGENARRHLDRAPRFDDAASSHVRAWNHIWRRFDIGLDYSGTNDRTPLAGEEPATILRLHVFHLVQTASPNTRDLDTGIPARGWHGESYRGHIFWDELFIFPLLNLRMPEVTRALLLYRHRRLDEARERARRHGWKGALYPWQSGSDGREETPIAHYRRHIDDWIPERTWMQRHISAAVVYNVWHYFQVTDDEAFLDSYGSEIILEAARFYSSLATYNERLERYEIEGVVGPDEYHLRYPDADTPGLRNNAYTNVMAVWVLCRALDVLEYLPRERTSELCERLGLEHHEIERWRDISHNMRVVFFNDGLISQFEGYRALPEFDWEHYRRKYDDLYNIDTILWREGDSTSNYKISKQADVLMLFYLLSVEELETLFDRLGYEFDPSTIPRHVDYYLERTVHGSSLSRIVHSWVTANHEPDRAWEMFSDAVLTDVADIKGGSTPEGIHLGAMAGTVDIVERSFVGIETRGGALHFEPNVPDEIDRLSLTVRYRGYSLAIRLESGQLRLVTADSNAPPIRVAVDGDTREMGAYEVQTFELD